MSIFKQRTAPDIEERIRAALDGMRTLLRIETMDVALVEFDADSGATIIRCAGDCPDCDLSVEHLTVGIEAHLRQQVPEIRSIRFAER